MHEKDTASEAELEPPQAYMMEFFSRKQFHDTTSSLFSQKRSIKDIWRGSKYASELFRIQKTIQHFLAQRSK